MNIKYRKNSIEEFKNRTFSSILESNYRIEEEKNSIFGSSQFYIHNLMDSLGDDYLIDFDKKLIDELFSDTKKFKYLFSNSKKRVWVWRVLIVCILLLFASIGLSIYFQCFWLYFVGIVPLFVCVFIIEYVIKNINNEKEYFNMEITEFKDSLIKFGLYDKNLINYLIDRLKERLKEEIDLDKFGNSAMQSFLLAMGTALISDPVINITKGYDLTFCMVFWFIFGIATIIVSIYFLSRHLLVKNEYSIKLENAIRILRNIQLIIIFDNCIHV